MDILQRQFNFDKIKELYIKNVIDNIKIKSNGVFDYLKDKNIIIEWEDYIKETLDLTLDGLLNFVKQNNFPEYEKKNSETLQQIRKNKKEEHLKKIKMYYSKFKNKIIELLNKKYNVLEIYKILKKEDDFKHSYVMFKEHTELLGFRKKRNRNRFK